MILCINNVLVLTQRYQIGPYRAIILLCLVPCGGPSWGEYVVALRVGDSIEADSIVGRYAVPYVCTASN